MIPALALEGLGVAYAGVRALRDVSLAIAPAGSFGLVGESGSGKTTAALAVMHALPPGATRTGALKIAGTDPTVLGPPALRRLRAEKVSMVFQDPVRALSPALRVGTQLAESYQLLGMARRDAREAAEVMLERVRIAEPSQVMRRYPHELSGGMAQRVVLAMALAKRPALLLLDEPTTGLDAVSAAAVLELVQELRRESGTALLLISHDLDLVGRVCETVGVLQAGTMVEHGATAEVLRRPHHPYTQQLLGAVPRGSARTHGPLADGAAMPPATAPRVAPPQGEVLAVAHLSRRTSATPRLADLGFSISAGETLGVTGPSGSGKTTLARIILGTEQADPGLHLRLANEALPLRLAQRSSAQRRALQAVFQNPDAALNRAHTVRRILTRALIRLGEVPRDALPARLDALMRQVRLDPALLARRPGELSGGQKQRVAIAHAFAGQPRVVICDEFTSALDLSVQATILNLMVELRARDGVATLLISHDAAVLRYLADRVLTL